jgi:hypothetical protein
MNAPRHRSIPPSPKSIKSHKSQFRQERKAGAYAEREIKLPKSQNKSLPLQRKFLQADFRISAENLKG